MSAYIKSLEQLPDNPIGTRRFPLPLRLVLLVCVGETCLTWLFAFFAHLLSYPKPYSWPYYEVQTKGSLTDRHSDLLIFMPNVLNFHSPKFFAQGNAFAYPPATALVYRMFSIHFFDSVTSFLCVLWAIVAVCAVGLVLAFRSRGISLADGVTYAVVLVGFSSPLAFELNRLNTEIVVFAVIAAAILAYRKGFYESCGALLGIAAAVKIYPLILLGLLLSKQKYIAIGIAVVVAACLTILGLIGETGSVRTSIHGTQAAFTYYGGHFVFALPPAIGWDHSLLNFFKLLRASMGNTSPLGRLYLFYMVTAAAASLALYFGRIRKLPEFNQIACLVVLTILITPSSFEYTLLHAYIAFSLFACLVLDLARVGREFPWAKQYAICFGVLFGLIGFAYIDGRTFQGPIKCLALLCLLGLAVGVPGVDLRRSASQQPS